MIKDFLNNKNIVFISRLILGGLFIYASLDKIINPLSFALILHHYRIMPPDLINFWAIILPWIEVASGILLIIGYRVKGANLIIGGLLFMFIGVLAITTIRGINVSCGCFSTSIEVKSNLALRIVEDFGMLALFLHIFCFYTPLNKQKIEIQPVLMNN